MSSKRYKAEVSAKINLSLQITGKDRGLHTLRMLVCPYEGFKDEVEFIPVDDAKICSVTGGVGICGVEASATFEGFDEARFCEFFLPKAQEIAKTLRVGGKLIVRKGIPLGAGLGGSSGAIVGALKAMCEYAGDIGLSTALDSGFLLSLGSDVPCMLYGKACVVEGVGEVVKPVEMAPGEFGIEIAEGGSDTNACYALYDKLKAENTAIDTSFCAGEDVKEEYCAIEMGGERIELYKNDLTLPASMLNDSIRAELARLKREHGCAFLSGSGSAIVYKTHNL